MKKTYGLLWTIFLWTILSACGDTIEFDEIKKNGVVLSGFRFYTEAHIQQQRLKEQGINSKIISVKRSDGNYFELLAAAEETQENALVKKINLEDNYRLSPVRIVDYEDYKHKIQTYDKSKVEPYKDYSSASLYTPLQQLYSPIPHIKHHRLLSLRTINTDYYNFFDKRELQFNLPRGLSQYQLHKKSKTMSEWIFEDPLQSLSFSFFLVVFKPNESLDTTYLRSLGQKILDTRYYKHESISFTKRNKLEGFRVDISLTTHRKRVYFMLRYANRLYILESTAHALHLMEEFISKLENNSISILSSPLVYHALFPLPKEFSDTFAYLYYRPLTKVWGEKKKHEKDNLRLEVYFDRKYIWFWQHNYFSSSEDRAASYAFKKKEFSHTKTLNNRKISYTSSLYIESNQRVPFILSASLEGKKATYEFSNIYRPSFNENELNQLIASFRLR